MGRIDDLSGGMMYRDLKSISIWTVHRAVQSADEANATLRECQCAFVEVSARGGLNINNTRAACSRRVHAASESDEWTWVQNKLRYSIFFVTLA